MIIALILASVFHPAVLAMDASLNTIQLTQQQNAYVFAISDYLRLIDLFLPVTDGICPIAGITFVIWSVYLAKRLGLFAVNVVRGSGAKI